MFRFNFPTAVVGAGSDTEIIFVNAAGRSGPASAMSFLHGTTTLSQTAVFVAFLSQVGEVEGSTSAVLDPGATTAISVSSILFTPPGNTVQVGHVDGVADRPGVIASEIIRLSLQGADVPPIGVSPSPACENPVAALRRNDEFDTGVALSNTNAVSVACGWQINREDGRVVFSTGATDIEIEAFGQFQFFPIGDEIPVFELGSVQFNCNFPVNIFSLFQRKTDGAIFSNAAGCP